MRNFVAMWSMRLDWLQKGAKNGKQHDTPVEGR